MTRVLALLAAAFLSLPGPCYSQSEKFEPQVGQAGKDVIWVPTPDEVVERMLTMAQIRPGEIHFDLGAGDGKIAIAAAEKGARATGIEYNPDMVKYANEKARAAGVTGEGPGKAVIRHGDIFVTDFSSANVVTLYLLPVLNMKLRPQILSLRPGTRIVSHSFGMEDWKADEISNIDGRRIYFWVVPAIVQGTWLLEAAGRKHEITLEQHFQEFNGTIALGESLLAGLREPRLRGTAISFAYVGDDAVRREFTGTVNGLQMEGTYRDDNGATGKWSARKR